MFIARLSFVVSAFIATVAAARIAAAAPAPFTLSPEVIRAENERLVSLGLDLRGQSFLSPRPFDLPPTAPRAFILPVGWFEAPAPEQVPASAVLADLDYLQFAMRSQYSGWETAERRGWNWSAFFDRWRAFLVARGNRVVPVQEAFGPFAELQQFQPDNHTVPLARHYFGQWSTTVRLTRPPAGPCTRLVNDAGATFPLDPRDLATQPRAITVPTLTPAGIATAPGFMLSHPTSRGRAVAVECGGAAIPVVADFDPSGKERVGLALRLAGLAKDMPAYRRLAPDVGYLRMPTMDGPNLALYAELAQRISSLTDGRERVLIIDARGNGGGELLMDVLHPWFTREELSTPISRLLVGQTMKQSCFEPVLNWGFMANDGRFRDPSPVARREIADGFAELMRPDQPSCAPRFESRRAPPGSGDYLSHRFDPRATGDRPLTLLLVDNRCGSNCESLTGILSTMPRVLIAGVSTFGVGEFGAVGDLMLPRSRVIFRMAMHHNDIFRDGRSFEGYGLPPDLLLGTAQANSPEFILALARWLKEVRPTLW